MKAAKRDRGTGFLHPETFVLNIFSRGRNFKKLPSFFYLQQEGPILDSSESGLALERFAERWFRSPLGGI